jgi:hypothetical protein
MPERQACFFRSDCLNDFHNAYVSPSRVKLLRRQRILDLFGFLHFDRARTELFITIKITQYTIIWGVKYSETPLIFVHTCFGQY